MFRRPLLAFLILFQYTLSVDVDLAVFNITVLGDDHRPVTGLTAGNFRVYEDGREEKIKIFQPEDTPSTVGLIIDNSGSMTNKRNEVVNPAWPVVSASHHHDETVMLRF